MDLDELRKLLLSVKDNTIEIEDALMRLKHLPFDYLGYAHVDRHRLLRHGFPEVIFGEGKSPEQILGIVKSLEVDGADILITRTDTETFTLLDDGKRKAIFHEHARCVVVKNKPEQELVGNILVITAGTLDIPVAEEAAVTSETMGNKVVRVYDVGVAGIHRILAQREKLEAANAIIVVAGMEGALPSVVGGLIDKPVIAVPTSVGYGMSLGGLAALLGMLNSCAPNVSVVNIDNGFGAGYICSLINKKVC